MYVKVAPHKASVRERSNSGELYVVTDLGLSKLAAELRAHGAGFASDGHAYISVVWLRSQSHDSRWLTDIDRCIVVAERLSRFDGLFITTEIVSQPRPYRPAWARH